MTEEKKILDDPIDKSTEAELDLDRHRMEEAVLATLAKCGPEDPFSETFLEAYNKRTLTFSRSDLEEVAKVLKDFVCIDGRIADEVLVRGKLRSIPAMEVLPRILSGARAVDTDTARAYVDRIHALDTPRGAERLGDLYRKGFEGIKHKSGGIKEVLTGLARGSYDSATKGPAKKIMTRGAGRLRDLCGKGVESIKHKGGGIKEVLGHEAHDLYDLAAKKLSKEVMVEAENAKGFLDTVYARRPDGRDYLGLDCGFRHLNEVLNGLTEGVFILAGGPGCGKTALAKQIADHVAEKEKVPVLFYSFEQSAEELRIKSMARLSQVDSRVIWMAHTGSETWPKIEKAADDYLRGPGPYLTIIEAGPTDTVEAIRAAALMAKRKAGADKAFLVLDYLQVIPAGKNAPDNIAGRIDWNLSELRRLSRDLQSPVLVVSALNRAAYGDPTKPLTLSTPKESRGIDYTADVVICLWRDSRETENLTGKCGHTRVEAHVLKNRNGELARINLNFTPSWGLFTEEGREDLDHDAVSIVQ
jgi:replicative DNA helicase